MRTTLRIVALILALSCSVSAGEIPHMVTGPPPPPPPASTSSTTPGDISTGVAGNISTTISEEANTTSMTETALNLLQSVFALF
jgi:hypothetical protein